MTFSVGGMSFADLSPAVQTAWSLVAGYGGEACNTTLTKVACTSEGIVKNFTIRFISPTGTTGHITINFPDDEQNEKVNNVFSKNTASSDRSESLILANKSVRQLA